MSLQTAHEAARTRRLLAAGIVAGPLFIAVVLIQALTREGFDPGRHPLSLLSLGELGWIQITNFVVTGVLYLAFAAGLRRALHPGRGRTWGPLLFGAVGFGLILSGVFVTDAGAGYPRGAPEGAPEQISWHGAGHTVGFVLANVGLVAGVLVLARRFGAGRQWGWVAGCVATAVVVLVLTSQPTADGFSVRALVATATVFGFVAAVAVHLRSRLRSTAEAAGSRGR